MVPSPCHTFPSAHRFCWDCLPYLGKVGDTDTMTSPHGYCFSPLSPSPSFPFLSHTTSRGPLIFCAQSLSAHFQDTIPHHVYTLESGVCWLNSNAQGSHSRLTATPLLHFLALWEFLLLVVWSIPRCMEPVESLLVDCLSLSVSFHAGPCSFFLLWFGIVLPIYLLCPVRLKHS